MEGRRGTENKETTKENRSKDGKEEWNNESESEERCGRQGRTEGRRKPGG